MFLLSFTIGWSGRRASSRRGSGRRGSQPFSRLLTRLVSLADTVVRPSRRRVRLVGLCSSRCRRLACWRTIFPVPVRRNRFDAPLWVLALGMFPLFYAVLEWWVLGLSKRSRVGSVRRRFGVGGVGIRCRAAP